MLPNSAYTIIVPPIKEREMIKRLKEIQNIVLNKKVIFLTGVY
jgi:hypothetical protein